MRTIAIAFKQIYIGSVKIFNPEFDIVDE